jgi:hypothetical protein
MTNFIKAIADLPNTFWGVCILFSSMWIAVHYNAEIGYYFAGVGSTLCGITHLQNRSLSLDTPQGKAQVNTNASDQTS